MLKFNVTPVADTPIITLTDRSSIDGVDIEGVEDLPIRFFQTEDGDNILSLQTTDERNTETLSLIVRKQVDLLNSEEEAIGNFVDAQTLASIGKTVSYDFGNLDDNGDPIGPEDAFEFSQDQFNNLSIKLPEHYEGNADLQVVAKSTHSESVAYSDIQTITVKAFPSVDDVSLEAIVPTDSVEDTAFYINLIPNQIDTGERFESFYRKF